LLAGEKLQKPGLQRPDGLEVEDDYASLRLYGKTLSIPSELCIDSKNIVPLLKILI